MKLKTTIATLMLVLIASCTKVIPTNCTTVVDKRAVYIDGVENGEYFIKYQEGTSNVYEVRSTQADFNNTIVGSQTCN